MEAVLTDPILTPIAGSFNWRVDVPFSVMDDVLGKIEIPQGFISDLGSIPRIFWNIIPPEGPATAGYLIHDWLYAKQFCSRYDADNCLLRLMTLLGIGYFVRYAVYWNLRAFGWKAWADDANKMGGGSLMATTQ